MSTCISRDGEYSFHTAGYERDYVCERCGALDEDAMIAELASLRSQLAAATQQRDDERKRYWAIQEVLDKYIGTEEEDGAGEGITADVDLLGQQRDEARAEAARMRPVDEAAEKLSAEIERLATEAGISARDFDATAGTIAPHCARLLRVVENGLRAAVDTYRETLSTRGRDRVEQEPVRSEENR